MYSDDITEKTSTAVASSTKFQNEWRYTSAPPYGFMV